MENGARVNGGLSASSIASSNYVSADGYIYSGSYMQSNSYIYAANYMEAANYIYSRNYVQAPYFYATNYVYAASYVHAGSYVKSDNYMYAAGYIQASGDVYVGGSLRLPNGWRITTSDGHFRVYHNDQHKMTMHSWANDPVWDNTLYVSPGGIKVDAGARVRLGTWEMTGSASFGGDFGIYAVTRSDYNTGSYCIFGGYPPNGMALMGRFGGAIYGTLYNQSFGNPMGACYTYG
jgi:hypothetical protein